jgi:hypothetical protein
MGSRPFKVCKIHGTGDSHQRGICRPGQFPDCIGCRGSVSVQTPIHHSTWRVDGGVPTGNLRHKNGWSGVNVKQALATKLGCVTGLNLAQMNRAYLPRWLNYFFYAIAEAAIISTDIGQVSPTHPYKQSFTELNISTGHWNSYCY